MFHLNREMYKLYMNVIDRAYENGETLNLELDSKLQEDFHQKYGEDVNLGSNFTVSPIVVLQNFHKLCSPSDSSSIHIQQYFKDHVIDVKQIAEDTILQKTTKSSLNSDLD